MAGADPTDSYKSGNASGTPSTASVITLAANSLQGILRTLTDIDSKMSSILGKAQAMPGQMMLPGMGGMGTANGTQAGAPAASFSGQQQQQQQQSGQRGNSSYSNGARIGGVAIDAAAAMGLASLSSAGSTVSQAYGNSVMFQQIANMTGQSAGNGQGIYNQIQRGYSGGAVSGADLLNTASSMTTMGWGPSNVSSSQIPGQMAAFAKGTMSSLSGVQQTMANTVSDPMSMMIAKAHGINFLKPNGQPNSPFNVAAQNVAAIFPGTRPTLSQIQAAFSPWGNARQDLRHEGMTDEEITQQQTIVEAWAKSGYGDIGSSNKSFMKQLPGNSLMNSARSRASASTKVAAEQWTGLTDGIKAANEEAQAFADTLKNLGSIVNGVIGAAKGNIGGLGTNPDGSKSIVGNAAGMLAQAAVDRMVFGGRGGVGKSIASRLGNSTLGMGGKSLAKRAGRGLWGAVRNRLPGAAGDVAAEGEQVLAADVGGTVATDAAATAGAVALDAVAVPAAVVGSLAAVGGAAYEGFEWWKESSAANNLQKQENQVALALPVTQLAKTNGHLDATFKALRAQFFTAAKSGKSSAADQILAKMKAYATGGSSGGSGLGRGASSSRPSGTASAAAPPTGNAAALLAFAEKQIGIPYVWGGGGPGGPSHGITGDPADPNAPNEIGLDCSGFVQFVFARFGIQLPRSTYDQVKSGRPVAASDVQAGDLVFFDGNSHVGIALSANRMINAPHHGVGVRIEGYSPRTCSAIRRVFKSGPGGGLQATTASDGSTSLVTSASSLLAETLGVASSAANLLGMTGIGSASSMFATDSSGGTGAGDTSGTSSGGGSVKESAMFNLARGAGFNATQARVMAAIGMAESSGNPRSHNTNTATGDNSYGLWQINMLGGMGPGRAKEFGIKSYDQLFNPATNAHAAWMIYGSQGFNAWSTYKSGAYRKFLNSYDVGAWDIARDEIAQLHKGEMVVPKKVAEHVRETARTAGKGHGSPVTINVYPAHADHAAARKLAMMVKEYIEEDDHLMSVGGA